MIPPVIMRTLFNLVYRGIELFLHGRPTRCFPCIAAYVADCEEAWTLTRTVKWLCWACSAERKDLNKLVIQDLDEKTEISALAHEAYMDEDYFEMHSLREEWGCHAGLVRMHHLWHS